VQKHTHGKGDIQLLQDQWVGRFLIQLYETSSFQGRHRSDGLALVKLEEGSGIHLTYSLCVGLSRRSKVTVGGFVDRVLDNREQLVLSVELPVYSTPT